MKTHIRLILLFVFVILLSCEKEVNNGNNNKDDDDQSQPMSIEQVNGYVQKGPYLNGTSVTLSELNADFGPTGKNYNTQILDNKGTFEINGIELESQYVAIQANGFYFNEVTGESSNAQLTLQAITDVSDSTDINVNVLTTLEKRRVEYLIAEGSSFADAKSQAQTDVLDIFGIDPSGMHASEKLDISKAGDDHAILMAVSVILQGVRSEAELSELLANIGSDIRTDGELNDTTLGKALINDISLINLANVRNNIEARFQELGVNATIGDFEKFVDAFKAGSEFIASSGIKYPENGEFGPNLLSMQRSEYPEYDGSGESTVSFSAEISKGTSLKVGFYPDYYIDTLDVVPNDTVGASDSLYYIIEQGFSDWAYTPSTNEGWDYTDYDRETGSRIFTSDIEEGTLDMRFLLSRTGSATLYIYENNSDTITRSKRIYWEED